MILLSARVSKTGILYTIQIEQVGHIQPIDSILHNSITVRSKESEAKKREPYYHSMLHIGSLHQTIAISTLHYRRLDKDVWYGC